jgi:hypothetical protein
LVYGGCRERFEIAGVPPESGDAAEWVLAAREKGTMAKLRHSWKLLREFTRFAHENKAYWIIPLMLVLGMIAFVVVAGQSAAPLLYALF